MKQILLSLLALLGVSTMASADGSTSWRFDDATQWSDWQSGGYTVSGVEVKNGLIFYAGSDTKVQYQTSGGTCLVGDESITYSNRLQLGGAGKFDLTTTEEDGVVTYNGKTLLGVPVEGPSKISVVAASSNSSGRNLVAAYIDADDANQEIAKYEVPIASGKNGIDNSDEGEQTVTNCLFEYKYEAEIGTTIWLYSDNSGINIFEITVEALETDDPGVGTAISNVNVEATEVARYNIAGQKISGEQKGINIIVYSDGSSKKVLVK